MIDDFINQVKKWAEKDANIESVILVGSYARGTNKDTSDIDLCIITTDKSEMVKNQDFTKVFGKIEKKKIEYYGVCTSIRVQYANKKEVEFGIVEPSWIETPLDAGTQKVLRDGYRVIIDKNNYFRDLDIAINQNSNLQEGTQ